jgi:hypothetical protein
MPRQLRVGFDSESCVSICRAAFEQNKLVYVARANKWIQYERGRSHIAYIGTTKNGASRIASSAVNKGEDILKRHGITSLDFHIVTCGKCQGAKTWRKLERGLIIRFRERFWETPIGNKAGMYTYWDDEKDWFYEEKLDKVIDGIDALT